MEVVILGFFALMVAVVVSTPALIALGFLLKSRNWTNARKQAVFIASGAFLACPVMVPAGTIVAVPLPNWIVCGFLMWNDPSEILSLPLWYAKLWHIHGPLFLGSAFLLLGIAKMVFFIPPQHFNKNTLSNKDSNSSVS